MSPARSGQTPRHTSLPPGTAARPQATAQARCAAQTASRRRWPRPRSGTTARPIVAWLHPPQHILILVPNPGHFPQFAQRRLMNLPDALLGQPEALGELIVGLGRGLGSQAEMG